MEVKWSGDEVLGLRMNRLLHIETMAALDEKRNAAANPTTRKRIYVPQGSGRGCEGMSY